VSTDGPIPATGTTTVTTVRYIDGQPYPLRPEALPVDRLAAWHGYSVDMHGDVPLDPRRPLKPTWDVFEDDGAPLYSLELDRIRLQAAGSALFTEMIALRIPDRPIRTGIFGWDTGSPPRIPPPAEVEKALHGLEILGLVRDLEAARPAHRLRREDDLESGWLALTERAIAQKQRYPDKTWKENATALPERKCWAAEKLSLSVRPEPLPSKWRCRVSRLNILPIVLPKPLYKQLEREAYAQDRDPLQQARWILKQALETSTMQTAPAEPASAVGVGR
jgi:hypothetical protein